MIVTHNIETISFESNSLCIRIDGQLIKLPLASVSKKLADANDLERSFYKISPSGYGIHWPLIDEDLSIDSILNNR